MLIDASKSSLLLIDVQERLLPVMAEANSVLRYSHILLKAAAELLLPISISEQYPKGLGKTIDGLHKDNAAVFEKTAFSCWRDEALRTHLISLHEGGRPQVVIAGIEAHVCVLQTAIDLSQAGFAVYVVADAVSSRSSASVSLAFDRLRGSGVAIVNTEMVVFEWLQKAGTPQFKTLSALIK